LLVKLDGIDQFPDEEEAASSDLVEPRRLKRLRNARGVKSATFIGYIDPDGIGHQLGPHLNPFTAIFTVAPKDGVTQGFRQHHSKTKPDGRSGRMSGEAVAGNQLDRLFDAVHITG
jgi:hypothetical protein